MEPKNPFETPFWYGSASDTRISKEEISLTAQREGFKPTMASLVRLCMNPVIRSQAPGEFSRATLFWSIILTKRQSPLLPLHDIINEYTVSIKRWEVKSYLSLKPEDCDWYSPDDFDRAAYKVQVIKGLVKERVA